jgi:CRP-like cAMP-binding protein
MSFSHAATTACLSGVPVFQQLTQEELGALPHITETRVYAKGEYIFREGEKSGLLFIVRKGAIKLSKWSREGKERIFRLLFPGDFFGQYALLEDRLHYADAEALDKTMVCVIRKNDFLHTIKEHPGIALSFLSAVNELLHQADEWTGAMSLLETEQRIAKLLLILHERNSGQEEFKLPVQKKELAALLGTTPETLSRKLASLENQGYIRLFRRQITIRNKRGLQELAN